MGILTGCSVCGHRVRDDFTTQARLIYVGKALRAPTESVERIRKLSRKLVMANQQLRPPTDRCQDQLRQCSVGWPGLSYCFTEIVRSLVFIACRHYQCGCFFRLKRWLRPQRQHAHEKDVLEGFEFMLRL